jgi:hypothetical protein
MSGFGINESKGFHMTLANGYTISVQFGPGNYGDNYEDWRHERKEVLARYQKDGCKSRTAEIAMYGADDEFFTFVDGEKCFSTPVQGWLTPNQVFEQLTLLAALPAFGAAQ